MPEAVEQTIEILLVDDHAVFRESVARLLNAEPGFKVVSHCGSLDTALETVRKRHVDVVLLDFDLGEREGTQFLHLAKQQGFSGKVLVVTAGVTDSEAAELVRNGVSGIFMKHNSAGLLAQGIRDVMSGKVLFGQVLLQRAMNTGAVARTASQNEPFTQRERQVLSYIFEGLANKEIAGRIGVSESSVKATLQQLFAKTGVRTRSQLVRVALEHYRDQL